MIFEGFIWIASFFKNVAGFFSSFARFSVFKFALRYFVFYTFYAFVIMLILFSLAFFYYIVHSIIQAYNMISSLMIFISSASTSGDDVVSALYYFLNVTGIIQGFNAFFPFLASALLFILIKALYRVTLFVYLNVMLKIAGFILKV